MDKNHEIRAILSGKVAFANGAYSVASTWKTGLVGMFNGGDKVKIFGISQMMRQYQSDSVDAAVYAAKSIFSKLGRSIRFQSEPELKACFLQNYLGNPVVLTLEETDEGVCVVAYTARTIFSGINLYHAFQTFEKHLPEDMRVTFFPDGEGKMEKVPKTREKHKDRRAKKRAEKLEKRAERINAKAKAAAQAVDSEDQ